MLCLQEIIDRESFIKIVEIYNLRNLKEEVVFLSKVFFDFNELKTKLEKDSFSNLVFYYKNNKELIFKKKSI